MKIRQLLQWFKILFSGKPHFVIGGADRPYLLRWYLVPNNRLVGIYLHKFLRDDDDRALHDHPWNFVSILFGGSYDEHTTDGIVTRQAFSIAFRPAHHRHRIELKTKHCWTVIIRGRIVRDWGFWCPKGFVHWKQFTAQNSPGEIGQGCGE